MRSLKSRSGYEPALRPNMYSKQVAEHIASPQNVGEVENPSGVGDVTNQVCMDRIRLTVRIVDGVISEAKFKANGCPPTLAAGSVLTLLIAGQSVSRARSLSRTDIAGALGRLPAAKMHCAMLAVDALAAALDSSENDLRSGILASD